MENLQIGVIWGLESSFCDTTLVQGRFGLNGKFRNLGKPETNLEGRQ